MQAPSHSLPFPDAIAPVTARAPPTWPDGPTRPRFLKVLGAAGEEAAEEEEKEAIRGESSVSSNQDWRSAAATASTGMRPEADSPGTKLDSWAPGEGRRGVEASAAVGGSLGFSENKHTAY